MSRQSKRRFEMRCCVPLCKNDADNLPKADEVSFHMFPESPELRQFWLDALDLNELFERDEKSVLSAVVCSEHFASADLYNTKSGFRKLRVGAVPLVIQESLEDEEIQYEESQHEDLEQLQICRICLETDTKLYPMGQSKYVEAYENLTGFTMSDDDRLSQTLCPECMQRLINHDKFREKSLKAELVLTELLNKTESKIKDEELKMERKKFGLTSTLVKQVILYDPYDLFIQEDTEFENDELNGSIKEEFVIDVSQDSRAKINPNKQTINPKPSVIQNTNTHNKSGCYLSPQKLARIAPKPNITPVRKYANPKIHKNDEKHEETNQTAKVYEQTYKNVPAIENEVIIKQEVDTDNIEQCVQVDYIPVIDVVIDNKFKIVRKEDLLLKNAQLIISNKKAMPIVQEVDMNRAIIKNRNNTPIGLDHNVINKIKGFSNQKNVAVQRKTQNRNKNAIANQTLPVIKGDRIIMPDDDTSILQNILTNTSPVHKKPKIVSPPQKTGDTYINKPKNLTPVKKDIQAIDKVKTVAIDVNNEVPLIDYEDQEYYEESVVETVTEDYLDSQSDDDSEFNNIKRHVAKIMKSQKNSSVASYTDPSAEETYTSIHIPDTEVTEGNDENNGTWDENNEGNDDNDENWEQDDYSEDQYEENAQNSDEAENDYNYIINEKTDTEAVKRTKMSRKRKSVLLNYGKTYFYDDLNDVIFTIQQLSFEEQLVEIRKRLHTTYKDTTYKCDLCFRGFMHKYAFDRHMSLHASNDGEYGCAVCKFKFRSAKLLEAHQAARHATKFSCNLCEFTTTAHEPARLHGMKHRGIKYQCPHCSEEGIRYTVLMDHIAIMHSPESLCSVCGLKLLSDEDLERHKQVRHDSDLVRWDNATHCDTCDVLFASEDAYRLHLGVSIKHDSEFISQHLRAKCSEEEEFIKCPSQYKKPEIPRPLTCEQCGIKLPTLRKYHAHFRREHPDKTRTFYPTMKKKVMCELCGRFFKAQWQYVEHLRLHTNERPFSCEHCGKTFITNRLLCAHRYVHGVGRARPDIKCKLCGKTFANKGNLHRHMGVHTDEKRFKCEICNTAYRQKAEMKSHYEHVHLRKPWPKRHRTKRDDGRTKSLVTSEDDSSQTFKEEIVEEMEIEY